MMGEVPECPNPFPRPRVRGGLVRCAEFTRTAQPVARPRNRRAMRGEPMKRWIPLVAAAGRRPGSLRSHTLGFGRGGG